MTEPISPFTIMAKPVCGTCNLDCSYCYYTDKAAELYPGIERPMMTDAILDAYTKQYIEAQSVQATFGWQGGEPTLAGLDFFRKAVAFQKQYRLNDEQVIDNALQTNGTLLDEAWCDFLAEEKFLVGLSIDGPPQWHDSFRRDHAGKPSFHKVWGALERMRARDVEFNVLVTLNSVNAPHAGDIYRYFVNRGVQYLQFIPILERNPDGTPTTYSCTPEQYGEFLLDVFEQWATRDVGKVSERFIDCVLHSLIFGRASQCCQSERCANAHILEWNGDLYVCDHFVYDRWRVGNIMQTPLAELARHPMLDEFAKLKTDLPEVCKACEYLGLCFGGCPKHHMPLYGDATRQNYFCEGYRRFFDEALPELRRMAEYFKRNQQPPLKPPAGQVQAKTPQQQAAFAAGPGPQPTMVPASDGPPKRNDPCPCGSGKKYKKCCGG
ncbi:MAG: anaerobic sulfatase maturase [Planctomycetes bacterium]|nr:anaerobic sulfatase maturase [Phycisphaerae bacterium]NBB96493.1 anaerobic sulfatase maturase [Planctomycetota bacterium]